METQNTDRGRPYCMSFYRLNKLAGRHKRNLTPYEIKKCKKDTIAFDSDNCISNGLDFSLKFKGKERKLKNKNVGNKIQLHAHNGSGFDTWIVLSNLPCDEHIVDIFKNGKGIISMRVFAGYIQNNKRHIRQYLIFRCGKTHLT